MSGLHVFLGLAAYLILTWASPLSDSFHFLNDSFDRENISSLRTVVTDNEAADFLTLLSAQFDVSNPNPADKGYVRDDSDGEGTTIFVLDSGFNLEKYPEEQCLDQRRIDTFVLEQNIRTGGPLTQEQINNGDYFPPPDNMDDIADVYGDRLFHGHGTPIAIVAAGCKTGVARKANLYLVKMSEMIMNSGVARSGLNNPENMLYAFHHVLSVLSGHRGLSIPRGKAIVLTSLAVELRDFLMQRYTAHDYSTLETDYKMVLDALDRQGATVIMAAGNGGNEPVPSFVDDSFPQHLATKDSPYIVVGSTNNKGQLSSFTSPGRGNVRKFWTQFSTLKGQTFPIFNPYHKDVADYRAYPRAETGHGHLTPVTVYAQGEDVTSYDLVHGTTPWFRRGTSFSAPIVAGLAAYTLGLPTNSRLCPYTENPAPGQDSVGMCLKRHLTRTAFQRVESNNLLAQDAAHYHYDIPERVLVVSNGATQHTEEGGGDNGGDPTLCWDPATRPQCKIANMTEM